MQKYQIVVMSFELEIDEAVVEIRLPLITTSVDAAKTFVRENLLPIRGTYAVTIVRDGQVWKEIVKKV
jgi:hypothetical protein